MSEWNCIHVNFQRERENRSEGGQSIMTCSSRDNVYSIRHR